MTQKGSKKRDPTINEDKDIFLSYLNKRTRNQRKKLDQIDELVKKDPTTLKPEQIEKIQSKNEVLDSVKYFDKIKDMYYEALKTAQESGKTESGEAIPVHHQKEEHKVEAPVEKAQPEPKGPSQTEIVHKILNFVHFAQLFADHSKREELKHHKNELHLGAIPDCETFFEFFTKVFTFSEGDKLEKVETKINTSIHELDLYLQSADKPALKNKSYAYLHETVEKVAHTQFFKDLKAHVHHAPAQTAAHHSAIGSELKHDKHHGDGKLEELRAESNIIHKEEKAKEHSPIKPAHKEQPKQPEILTSEQLEARQREQQAQEKAQQAQAQAHHQHQDHQQGGHHGGHQQGGNKVDWTQLEDDEHRKQSHRKNNQGNKHHDKKPKEEEKVDADGFRIVEPNVKKQETKTQRPFKSREGGDRKEGGDRPYKPREGGDRPYKPREEGDRPYKPREGGDRPYKPREGGDRREGGERREGGKPQYERKFVPKEGGAKPETTQETKP